MKKIWFLLLFAFTFQFSANAQFKDLLNKAKKTIGSPVEDSTGAGLKEALVNGVEAAVDQLSATNGYFDSPYKILIPKEAQQVVSKVKMVPGFQNVEQDLIKKMNEAAEIAAKKASPIFVGAIKELSFKDAMSILMGDKNAATQYLDDKTRPGLYSEFMPVIQSSLDEVNARTYWKSVVDQYNKIPFIKKLNPELDDHVNQYALNGLFALVEKKEEGIRGDVSQRTSPLLRDVFSKQD